jgi:hypothetical protein
VSQEFLADDAKKSAATSVAFPTREDVLNSTRGGLVLFMEDGKLYKAIVCGGCIECMASTEDSAVFVRGPAHFQMQPIEVVRT